METLSPEQVMAAGAIGFAIVGVTLFIAFLLNVGSFRLATGLLGNNKPTFIGCMGWVFAIWFVNTFIVSLFVVLFGWGAAAITMPLSFAITLYITSLAADCGWIQAFGIHILNTVFAVVITFGLLIAITIPLAAVGAMAGNVQTDRANQTTTELETLDEPELVTPTMTQPVTPPVTPVKWDETEKPKAVSAPTPQTQFAPKPPKMQPKRAKDGSTLNPFFQSDP